MHTGLRHFTLSQPSEMVRGGGMERAKGELSRTATGAFLKSPVLGSEEAFLERWDSIRSVLFGKGGRVQQVAFKNSG